ncbi:MAG: WD40 repeat domain-containing protein [Campylobacteraceae bacterium]
MRVLTIVIFFLTSTLFVNAQTKLYPSLEINASASVISSFVFEDSLHVTTDKGTVEIFDTHTLKPKNIITLSKITGGYTEELVSPRVINVDAIDSENLLILSEDSRAGRALYIYNNGNFIQVFSFLDKLNISKAYFYDKNRLLLGLLSNELILYDIPKKEFIYKVQPHWSMLADFTLSSDRQTAFLAGESGIVYMYNVKDGKKIREFSLHVNIIQSQKFASNTLITGGSDKKINVVQTMSSSSYSLNANFPVYAVGISPSGKIGAYVANEDNDINIFNTITKEVIATLHGINPYVSVNGINFLNEKEIVITSSSKTILKWELP